MVRPGPLGSARSPSGAVGRLGKMEGASGIRMGDMDGIVGSGLGAGAALKVVSKRFSRDSPLPNGLEVAMAAGLNMVEGGRGKGRPAVCAGVGADDIPERLDEVALGRTVACIRASEAAVGCINVFDRFVAALGVGAIFVAEGAGAAVPAGMTPEMLLYENADGGGGAGRAVRIISA